jgi:hypothetical protein
VVKQCISPAAIVVINSLISLMNHAIAFVLHQVDLQAEVMDDVQIFMKQQNF